MQVLQKAITPDGIAIQIEDWRDLVPSALLLLVAYPAAKRDCEFGFSKAGQIIRLNLFAGRDSFKSDDEVISAFEAMKTGSKQLDDFSNYFDLNEERY